MRNRLLCTAALFLAFPIALTGCNGPRVIHVEPILATGDRTEASDSVVARAAAHGRVADARSRQDSINAVATSSCAPSLCAAIARGEVVLGMSEAQLLAATGSAPAAWTSARSGATLTLTPTVTGAPRDVNGAIVQVQLQNDRVTGVSYAERTGTRVVYAASDTSAAARSRAIADALIREGDDFIAAGDRVRALERYDRALVMRENDPMLTYKVAQLLDQQLRPAEALMRYQRFLLQMELQRIDAVGTQNAKLAEAIALAQQRVIVLDRRPR